MASLSDVNRRIAEKEKPKDNGQYAEVWAQPFSDEEKAFAEAVIEHYLGRRQEPNKVA